MITVATQPRTNLTPTAGEDQIAFATRYHTLMAREIPDTDARNAAMFKAWFDAGDPLLKKARYQWPKAKYRMTAPVAVFDQHVAQNGDGSTTHYDHDNLAAIARNMNDRIRSTGNYAALTDGHTTDEPTDPQPEVLGYSGPFYLGQIDSSGKPRWAIFATEWHRKDAAPILHTHRTRSPEVWLTARLEDRVMDPIAALGAERPRRDLGMAKYSLLNAEHQVERYGARGVTRLKLKKADGVRVERYSAATAPGGSNTCISKEHYTEQDSEEGETMALSDEDARKIAQYAVQILVEMNWAPRDGASNDGNADPDAASDDGGITGGADAATDAPPDDEESGDDADDGMDVEDEAADVDSQDESEESDSDAVIDADADTEDESSEDATSDQTARLIDRIAALQAENTKLKQQFAKVGGEKKEHYRRSKLNSLRKNGFQIDVDECAQLSEDFDDVQFERYAKSLERNAVRVPLADEVGDLPVEKPKKTDVGSGSATLTTPGAPQMERYVAKAMKKHRAEVAAGRSSNFDDWVQKAIDGKI